MFYCYFECCMRFDVVLALLVSTCRAMREPQFVERVTGLTPRFLYIYIKKILTILLSGVIKDKVYLL